MPIKNDQELYQVRLGGPLLVNTRAFLKFTGMTKTELIRAALRQYISNDNRVANPFPKRVTPKD